LIVVIALLVSKLITASRSFFWIDYRIALLVSGLIIAIAFFLRKNFINFSAMRYSLTNYYLTLFINS